jgi:hypothetical protein
LEVLQAAALEICQEVEEGVAQAGGSLAIRLRALGGHVSQRMRRTLHLAIKKALGVSAVLVEERMEADTLKQFPIYCVFEALSGSELFYSEMEKMAYAVVMAKRKLRHYFQSHNISVPTAFPLRDMFENKESTGRMGKWATELADMSYTLFRAVQ